MTDDNDERLREVHERTRRIETRLTRLVEAMGVDAGGLRPVWTRGTIVLPSMACSLRDILAVVPRSWPASDPIDLLYKSEKVGTITVQ